MARVWKDHGLKPWKTDTFKVSSDPHFEEKLVDVVGLYMNPPERAVVFSFDEKSERNDEGKGKYISKNGTPRVPVGNLML